MRPEKVVGYSLIIINTSSAIRLLYVMFILGSTEKTLIRILYRSVLSMTGLMGMKNEKYFRYVIAALMYPFCADTFLACSTGHGVNTSWYILCLTFLPCSSLNLHQSVCRPSIPQGLPLSANYCLSLSRMAWPPTSTGIPVGLQISGASQRQSTTLKIGLLTIRPASPLSQSGYPNPKTLTMDTNKTSDKPSLFGSQLRRTPSWPKSSNSQE